jgi:hypothetical protein
VDVSTLLVGLVNPEAIELSLAQQHHIPLKSTV